ncbi:unannotated protein [freshwater metagenome]|uniref:Unannotated protein n=1 Tax=freshwater metagenome TaxID=449393 RepID=A0A6J6N302_9ZZZZ
MYPLLSITKPVPVDPPSLALASIDTTDGITRFAISATEPGARSTELEVLDKFIDCPNKDPDDDAPKIAPTRPATKARSIALARVIKFALPFLLAGIHHGPFEPLGCEVLINPSSYSFVASNKPSPIGMREVTQRSVSFFIDFPASRSATVLGSR